MKRHWPIIVILLLAAALRLYGLGRGDTVNDEVFYAFRGIGMLDFDKASTQKTPLEWWDQKANPESAGIPWWTKLSFHDHPPLVFWVEGIFMKIFGEKRWAFRLPSALLGIASVWLVYLFILRITNFNELRKQKKPLNLFAGFEREVGRFERSERAQRETLSEPAGESEESKKVRRVFAFIAAAIFAVTLNNVYISRTGMQEVYVIFFMLLAGYLFLKAIEIGKYLTWLGIVLGLAFLTKYTTFILVPVFLIYLLLFNRALLLNKKLWLGAFLSLMIFSPVLIYNIQLYRAVGHFDFQISHIIGRVPDGWQEAPGKEIGTFGDRLTNFIPRLIASNSWLFLILFVTSFCLLLFQSIKKSTPAHVFLFLVMTFLIFLLLFIGPSYRFLTMLTPWMALSIGASFQYCLLAFLAPPGERGSGWRCGALPDESGNRARAARQTRSKATLKAFAVVAFAIILIFESFYTWNNQIAYYPKGPEPWLASKVRYENYNWGYNSLEEYFEKELRGKMPALTFDTKYQFLNDIQDKALAKAEAAGLDPYPALIVYYGNFDDAARLWIFDRLHIYHGWPIITFDTYLQYLKENGADYYKRTGFEKIYFIQQTNIVPSPEFQNMVGVKEPLLIQNPRGDTVFRVFIF